MQIAGFIGSQLGQPTRQAAHCGDGDLPSQRSGSDVPLVAPVHFSAQPPHATESSHAHVRQGLVVQ
jgi:hypothetical protein